MNRHRDSGMTLIEVLVSISILAILAVAFYPMMVQATKLQLRSNVSAQALSFARSRLEEEIEAKKYYKGTWPPEERIEDPTPDSKSNSLIVDKWTFGYSEQPIEINGDNLNVRVIRLSLEYVDASSPTDKRTLSLDAIVPVANE